MKNRKKSKGNKEALMPVIPLKYSEVSVNPHPCSLEEQALHIHAFIDTFIITGARERWRVRVWEPHQLWLQHRRSKSTPDFHRVFANFEADCIKPFCKSLVHTDAWPIPLSRRFGNQIGIFFHPGTEPSKFTAAEASTQAFEYNAIWSLNPGTQALLFLHDGITWLCRGEH